MFSRLADERPTYGERLASYERREDMTIWVGAGFGGVALLLAGDLTATVGGDKVPPLVIGLALTFVVIGVVAIAFARVGFEWEATKLSRAMKAEEAKESERLEGEVARWPWAFELLWRAALWLLVLAGAAFLLGVWWSVI